MIASARPPRLLVLLALLLTLAGCDATANVERTSNDDAPQPAFELTALQKSRLLFPALHAPRGKARRCVHRRAVEPPGWLHEAVEGFACTPLVRAVVEQTAETKPDATPASAQDLLTAAAICDDDAAIARELGRGADPNRRDACGATALVAAASAGRSDAVRALLEAGARPNLMSQQGAWSRTALLAALIASDVATAGTLLDAGAGANAKTPRGRSVLMFAAAIDDEELIRELLRRRANACHRDELGLSAIDVARGKANMRILSLLFRAERKCSTAPAKHS